MHQLKKERVDEDEEEEMELDDDDDPSTKNNQPAPTGMYYLILDTIKPLTMNLMCKRGARGSSAAFYATPLYKFTARSYWWCTGSIISTVRRHCKHLLAYIDDILARYQGFQSTLVAQSPTLSPTGAKMKMAQVYFDTAELASVAKEALDGFSLKKGWKMTVAYF